MMDIPIGHMVGIYTVSTRRTWRTLWLRRRQRLVTTGILTDITSDSEGAYYIVRDPIYALRRMVA